MKNILKTFVIFCIGVALFSCSKEEDNAIYSNTASGTLQASSPTVVLTMANADKEAVKFTWARPEYNPGLAPVNKLQIALKGTNFLAPYTVTLDPTISTLAFSNLELNKIMMNLGATFTATGIEARVVSSFPSASTIAPIYSNILVMTVTPYALTSYIYTPGAYQGWDPGTSNALVSANSNGIYIGYINFPSAGSEFKITADKTGTTNYGDDGANGTLEVGGANIAAPAAGFYKLTVNMNTKTYTMVPYSMGIVGSATPNAWAGPDLQMSWDNATTSWIYTGTFAAGEIKFRTNNVWTESYGGANGVITNDNITVTAGTHTVRFNPFTMTYSVQ